MYKSCSNQDTSTKVLGEEEKRRRDLHPLHLLCHNRKAGTEYTSSEDND
jgi:hypothetical protein